MKRDKVVVRMTLSGYPLQVVRNLHASGLWGTTIAKVVRELAFRTLREEDEFWGPRNRRKAKK